MRKRSTAAEKFWLKVTTSNQCWLWEGCRDKQGYGRFSIYKTADKPVKHMLSHRFAWELTHGQIPKGLCVLHRCDNPPCVNPAHLFLGTIHDNNHDSIN